MIVGIVGALNFRPGPQAMSSVKAKLRATDFACLAVEFVKLILLSAETIAHDAWAHIRKNDELYRSIRKMEGVFRAAIFLLFDAIPTSPFATFLIICLASPI